VARKALLTGDLLRRRRIHQYPVLEIWSWVGGTSVTVLIGDQDVVHNHGPEAAVAHPRRHIPALFIVIPFRGG